MENTSDTQINSSEQTLSSQSGYVSTSQNKQQGALSSKTIVTIAVVLIIGLVAGGGMWYFSQSSSEEEPTREVFVEEQAEPTDEPEPEISKSDFSIQVLNGSGIEGAAGTAKDKIEGAGFTVETTGNASAYDYKDTEIQRKEGVPMEVYEELSELLSDDVEVVEGDSLSDDAEYDIIIIIGGATEETEDDSVSEEEETEDSDVLGTTDENDSDLAPSPSPTGSTGDGISE